MCSHVKSGEKTKIVNLALNPERNTGYNGTHLWNAIYQENCIAILPGEAEKPKEAAPSNPRSRIEEMKRQREAMKAALAAAENKPKPKRQPRRKPKPKPEGEAPTGDSPPSDGGDQPEAAE